MNTGSNLGAGAQQTGDIPNDYKPIANNFEAPAHSHLNKDQAAEIIRIAEGSHHDTGARSSTSELTGTGSGSGVSSSQQHLQQARDVLGGGTGSVTQTHTGQPGNYELGQGDLAHNRTSLTGSDRGYPSSGTGLGAGAGAGAAGLGAGGLAATAANQGLGSRDQLGSSTGTGIGSGSSTGLSSGNTNQPAHSSQLDTSANSSSGPTAASGTLENKLQSELERNARKAGTHAAGFGTAGMSSDSGKLHSSETGISNTSGGPASGGHGQGQSGLAGGLTGATAIGTGAAGLSGQHPQTSSIPMPGSGSGATGLGAGQGHGQGLESRLAHEVENRAHQTGSNNVTGLGASGVRATHDGTSSTGLGGNLGHSTGQAL